MLISLLDLGPPKVDVAGQLSQLGQQFGQSISDYKAQRDTAEAYRLMQQGQAAQAGGLAALFGQPQQTQQSAPVPTAPAPSGSGGIGGSGIAPLNLSGARDPSIPSLVSSAAQGVGIDPGFAARLVSIESKGNPNAVSPTGAKGLGQFTSGTWKTYGQGFGNPFDPQANVAALANLTADNADKLGQVLGREPTQGETYLAHQQGVGGATALLSNPSANVVDALSSAYGGDRQKAARAVVVNGGNPGMTAGQFASQWTSKFPNAPVRTAMADVPADPAVPPAGGQAMVLPAAAQGGAPAPQPAPQGGIAGLNPSAPTQTVNAAPAPAQAAAPPLPPARPPMPVATGVRVASADPSFVPQTPPAAPAGNPSASEYLVAQAQARQGQNPAPSVPAPAAAAAPATWSAYRPDPSIPDPEVAVPGYPGTWTRAKAAQAHAQGAEEYPEPTEILPAQGLAAPAHPATAGAPSGGTGAVTQQPQAVSKEADFVPGTVASPALSGGRQLLTQPVMLPQPKAGQIPPELAARLLLNPKTQNVGQAIVSAQFGNKGGSWEVKELANGQSVLFNPSVGMVPLGAAKPTAFGFQKVGENLMVTNPDTGAISNGVQGPPKLSNVAAGSTVIDDHGRPVYTAPADPTKDSNKFAIVQTGQDQYGNKTFGRMDKTTGEISAVPPVAGAPGASQSTISPETLNLHGDEFMKTLDPQIAGQVKAIVEGRAPYPTGMLLKTPYGQKLAEYVTQADPTFETGNATSRVKVRSEFNSGGPGAPAGQITAGNTAIQHLGHLSDAAEALGNLDIGIPGNNLANMAINKIAQSAGRGTAVTQFNNILGKYVEEATKFYRGSGGTEADIQRDLGNLNSDMSPTQLRTALHTQVDLLQSKINALQDRWKQGMGPLVQPFPIIQPDSQQALNKIAKRAGVAPQNAPEAPTGAPQAAQGQPAQQAPQQPAQAAPRAPADGDTATNPNTGERVIRQNGRWVPIT